MKKLVLCLIIIAFALNTNAQEKGKVRVGLDAGLAFPNAGVGIGGDLDIRYNIMDNLNVGVNFGLAALVKDIVSTNGSSNYSATASAITHSLVTGDYYFNKPESSFAPFLGGGFGTFSIGNMQVTSSSESTSVPSSLTIDHKFGGLFRGGFEAGRFRMALEYYLIPRSTLVNLNNAVVGTSGNSYLNLSIGFYLWGGKWKK
ncbi:MAG: OmpW family outer membrane protein [Paludibacter sp.]|nr:OmpW family outer membrane protein [Paludibacter sp.]